MWSDNMEDGKGTPRGQPANGAEQLLPLREAARLPWLPKHLNGKGIHVSTLFRWSQHGLRGVKLRTLKVGGVRATTEGELLRFFEMLANRSPAAAPNPPPSRRRAQEIARAARRAREILGR